MTKRTVHGLQTKYLTLSGNESTIFTLMAEGIMHRLQTNYLTLSGNESTIFTFMAEGIMHGLHTNYLNGSGTSSSIFTVLTKQFVHGLQTEYLGRFRNPSSTFTPSKTMEMGRGSAICCLSGLWNPLNVLIFECGYVRGLQDGIRGAGELAFYESIWGKQAPGEGDSSIVIINYIFKIVDIYNLKLCL